MTHEKNHMKTELPNAVVRLLEAGVRLFLPRRMIHRERTRHTHFSDQIIDLKKNGTNDESF
jgi:hypothetical protein